MRLRAANPARPLRPVGRDSDPPAKAAWGPSGLFLAWRPTKARLDGARRARSSAAKTSRRSNADDAPPTTSRAVSNA